MSVTPTFGIATFTTYTFASSASDPDGDSLTYSWDLAGNARSGASQTIVFINGGDFSGTVTVSDGKGGTASQSVNFTSASTTGSWTGNIPFTIGPRPMSLTMTQSTTSGATTAKRDDGERLYFVVETKSGLLEGDIRSTEQAKIDCGRQHFKALQVHEDGPEYVVSTSGEQFVAMAVE